MKAFKYFSIMAIAALLLVPTTAMAKTNFNFSLNLFDCLAPMLAPHPVFVAPMPPPVYYYAPCPPPVPRYHQRTIVKEYHYYHQAPQVTIEEINPSPQYHYYPQHR